MDEHWLDGPHGPIRYRASSERRGLPLLFIHGYGGLIEHWRRLFPLLGDTYTLYAFDLYNLGYSARLKNVPPSKELWAEQTAHVINTVIGEPAVLVGHSMGGMVAAQVAKTHPHLARALVISNSMGLPPDREPNAFERAMFGMIRAPIVGDVLAQVVTNSWAVRQSLLPAYYDKDKVTPELVEIFSGPLRQPGAGQAYLAISRGFQNYVLAIQPGEVQQPVLIFWGEADRSMLPALAAKFKQQLFPHAEVHIIPEAAHCPFDEQPEAFAETLRDWLEHL
jgi:pimeloyl-ACP methyl ester carboxylesterase